MLKIQAWLERLLKHTQHTKTFPERKKKKRERKKERGREKDRSRGEKGRERKRKKANGRMKCVYGTKYV